MKWVILFFLVLSLPLALANIEIISDNSTQEVLNLAPPGLSGVSGNSSFNQSLSDTLYLRLDATNDPVTGQVEFQSGNGKLVTTNSGGAISAQTSTGQPGYISFGNTADIGISTDGTVDNYDYDGSLIFKQKASNPQGNAEFIFIEEAGDWRFALPKSGTNFGTYNPRSLIIAGPSVNNGSNVECDYWGFTQIDCDTGATGADLGVQDDLEIMGTAYTLGGINLGGSDLENANSLELWNGFNKIDIYSSSSNPIADFDLTIFSPNYTGYEARLDFSDLSGDKNYHFPNKSGTIALTSEVNSSWNQSHADGLYQPLEDQRLSTTDDVYFEMINATENVTITANLFAGTGNLVGTENIPFWLDKTTNSAQLPANLNVPATTGAITRMNANTVFAIGSGSTSTGTIQFINPNTAFAGTIGYSHNTRQMSFSQAGNGGGTGYFSFNSALNDVGHKFDTNTNDGYMQWKEADAHFKFFNKTVFDKGVNITGDLHVNGNINVTGNIQTDGCIIYNGGILGSCV